MKKKIIIAIYFISVCLNVLSNQQIDEVDVYYKYNKSNNNEDNFNRNQDVDDAMSHDNRVVSGRKKKRQCRGCSCWQDKACSCCNEKKALTGAIVGGAAGAGIGYAANAGVGAAIGGPVGLLGGVLISQVI